MVEASKMHINNGCSGDKEGRGQYRKKNIGFSEPKSCIVEDIRQKEQQEQDTKNRKLWKPQIRLNAEEKKDDINEVQRRLLFYISYFSIYILLVLEDRTQIFEGTLKRIGNEFNRLKCQDCRLIFHRRNTFYFILKLYFLLKTQQQKVLNLKERELCKIAHKSFEECPLRKQINKFQWRWTRGPPSKFDKQRRDAGRPPAPLNKWFKNQPALSLFF